MVGAKVKNAYLLKTETRVPELSGHHNLAQITVSLIKKKSL